MLAKTTSEWSVSWNLYRGRGISWVNVLCDLFWNLSNLLFLPLSPLWCKFQNKTGTEPLTQQIPRPLYIPTQRSLRKSSAAAISGEPAIVAAATNNNCRLAADGGFYEIWATVDWPFYLRRYPTGLQERLLELEGWRRRRCLYKTCENFAFCCIYIIWLPEAYGTQVGYLWVNELVTDVDG